MNISYRRNLAGIGSKLKKCVNKPKTAVHPCPYLKILSQEPYYLTKKFAIDSFDIPEKEPVLGCTVFTLLQRKFLAFLRNLAKCDILVKKGPGTTQK